MRAIHFGDAAHAFSGYAARHPLHCAIEAIACVSVIVLLSGLLLTATDPKPATAAAAPDAVELKADSPEWIWTRRVTRGSYLYPGSP